MSKKDSYTVKRIRILEKRLAARNKKIISKIFIDFSKKIAMDNSQKYLKISIETDYEWLKNKFRTAFEGIYLYTFKETSKLFQELYKIPKTKVIKGITDYFLKDWNKKNAALQAKNVTETTRKILNRIIAEGQEAGISYNEMVSRLMSEVEGMAEQRATTIARTETIKSINTTSFETAKACGMNEKCWKHRNKGSNSRLHHQILAEKWVDIDHKWILKNGVEADYPHQAGLPASEVVRCNCLVTFRWRNKNEKTKEEEN